MDMNEQAVVEEEKDAFFSRESIAGVPWMVVSKAILFFVYFAISVLLVRLLGDVQYGVYAICMNIAESAGVLCSLGLIAALFRFVPELVVQKNKAGLKRLLWKSFALQGGMVLLVTVLFVVLKPLFNRWFNIDFHHYLWLCGIMIMMSLLKENVSAVETSLFRVKNVSILSLIRGLLLVALIAIGLRRIPTVTMAISIYIGVGLVYVVGAALMFRHIYSFNWCSPLYGIGKRRTMKFSGAIMSSTILRMMTMKYTEVFFLGIVAAPEIVGAYDLGYSLPLMVIFFVPDALHMLFTSGFAEAYSRDKNCLPRLIKAYYKMQIAFTVPLAVFGFFFAIAAVRLVYGEKMALAGGIASVFCIIHLLSTISAPLSMALKAKEKVMASMPIMIFQIAVNLALDWLLIVHFKMGTTGAMIALTAALVLSMPVRITIIRKILGGIYFPIAYMLRMSISLLVLAGSFALVSNHWKLLELFQMQWINLIMLFALGGLYMLCYLLAIRFLRLIREEDISDFRALGIKQLNKVFDLLSPPHK